jgi:deazaflavin-dependent oxidoreductase (nitroreductase family)
MANAVLSLLNRVLIRIGLRKNPISTLTVKGRKTGKDRSVEIRVIEYDGQRWLVAPYGTVNWLHNIRAVRQAVLSNGNQSETIWVEEVAPAVSAPILQQYLTVVEIVRSQFSATPTPSLADFEIEATRHPVFRITRSTPRRALS